jgi:hypothetical protein
MIMKVVIPNTPPEIWNKTTAIVPKRVYSFPSPNSINNRILALLRRSSKGMFSPLKSNLAGKDVGELIISSRTVSGISPKA